MPQGTYIDSSVLPDGTLYMQCTCIIKFILQIRLNYFLIFSDLYFLKHVYLLIKQDDTRFYFCLKMLSLFCGLKQINLF